MGRIVASVEIQNILDPEKKIRCDALVDTGTSHLVIPATWRQRLADMKEIGSLELEIATQQIVQGIVCGSVQVQIEGFCPIFTELIFVEMEPVEKKGHRLIHVKRLDLK